MYKVGQKYREKLTPCFPQEAGTAVQSNAHSLFCFLSAISAQFPENPLPSSCYIECAQHPVYLMVFTT